MNLEGRVDKIEKKLADSENLGVNLELYAVNGEKVDNAKIVRLPKTWKNGLAVLSDDTQKEIACEGKWRDIILESQNSEIPTSQESQADCLFLRKNGQISAVETIYSEGI